jgi:NADH-quinone oxidoreductase subunit L
VALSILFAALVFWKPVQVLDPEEARAEFPRVHAFLSNKWYFDELYQAVLVRPALVVASWARAFDGRVIDGLVDGLGRFAVTLSRWDGLFDARIIDGTVNWLADTVESVGARLRGLQTGFLRSYVLFLVIAAVGIFLILTFFVTKV